MAKAKRETEIFEGPTAQRLLQEDGVDVNGDNRADRRWTARPPLYRFYERMEKNSPQWMQDQLRAEYAALDRFYVFYVQSAMNGSIGGMDMDGQGGEGRRSFLAATERQAYARNAYRAARIHLNHHQGIVVQNVVCNDLSLEIAGYAIGKNSKTRAIEAAGDLLRDAGFSLARFWGMVR